MADELQLALSEWGGVGGARRAASQQRPFSRAGSHSSPRKLGQNHESLEPPRSATDVRNFLDDSMREWGIEPKKGKAHDMFRAQVKCLGESIFDGSDGSNHDLRNWTHHSPRLVSQDSTEAIHAFLTRELEKITKDGKRNTITTTVDAFALEHGKLLDFPPYYWLRCRGYKNERRLQLNKAYKEVSVSEDALDPLSRFKYVEKNAKTVIEEDWLSNITKGTPNHIVRAAAVYHVVHHGRCLDCGAKELCWNAAVSTKWNLIVCEGCSSVYNLSIVASYEKLVKIFERGSPHCRSFAHYHELVRRMPPRASFFMILVDRGGWNNFPVYAAEIRGLIPCLTSDSFNLSRIQIFSKALLAPVTKNGRPWIQMPLSSSTRVYRALSKEILDDFFDKQVSSKPVAVAPARVAKDSHQTVDDVQARVRSLRRKRNQILMG